jgi:CRP-like cAMP-binding protein
MTRDPSRPTAGPAASAAGTPAGTPASPFAPLFEAGRQQHVRAGAILFSEGDVSNRVILVVSGRLKVSSFAEDGRESVIGVRSAGDLLGEFGAIDGGPHSATVTVVEAGEVISLPADRFVSGLEARPALALRLLRSVVGRLREADRRRVEFTSLQTDDRVAHRLDELVDEPGAELGPDGSVTLVITQAELAGWIGSSREAVNKALARLRDHGLVAVARGRIVVLDPPALRRRVQATRPG